MDFSPVSAEMLGSNIATNLMKHRIDQNLPFGWELAKIYSVCNATTTWNTRTQHRFNSFRFYYMHICVVHTVPCTTVTMHNNTHDRYCKPYVLTQ